MRRTIATLLMGCTAALGVATPSEAQAPVTMLCVAVAGPAPTIGWTRETLAAALADGSATLELVAEPSSCGVSSAPTNHTLTGSVTIPAPAPGGKRTWRDDGAGGCYGVNSFSHIFAFVPVTVQTLVGDALASGYLGDGVIDPAAGSCVFPFTILGVPPAVDYIVAFQLGKHFYLPAEQMDEIGWRLDVVAASSPGSWTGPGA